MAARVADKVSAAKVIQSAWRRHLIRYSEMKVHFNQFLRLFHAATIIQASYRKGKTHSKYLEVLGAVMKIQAATKIQSSIFRPWLCERIVARRRHDVVRAQ